MLSYFIFKLAPKVKEAKPKTENTDPNVQKEPKAKGGAKKPKKAGAAEMARSLYTLFIVLLYFQINCNFFKVPPRRRMWMTR